MIHVYKRKKRMEKLRMNFLYFSPNGGPVLGKNFVARTTEVLDTDRSKAIDLACSLICCSASAPSVHLFDECSFVVANVSSKRCRRYFLNKGYLINITANCHRAAPNPLRIVGNASSAKSSGFTYLCLNFKCMSRIMFSSLACMGRPAATARPR